MSQEGTGTPRVAEVIRGECSGQGPGWLEERPAASGAQPASPLGPVALGRAVLVTPVSYTLSTHAHLEPVKLYPSPQL